MTKALPSRFTLRRGVLIILGLLVALLTVDSPDRVFAAVGDRANSKGTVFDGDKIRGDRSHGATMWVADANDAQFYAYAAADTTPSFGGATIADQTYTQNEAIPTLQLPAATGGDGALSYWLEGTLPAGLTFNANTRRITGTPTATKAATTYRYVVTDGDASDPDSDELTFSITVTAAAIWTATLTVGATQDVPPRLGYRYLYSMGSLTDGTLSHMGSEGRWEDIVLRKNGRFELSAVRTTGSKVSGSYKVCFDGTSFAFNPLGGDNLNEVEYVQFPYSELSWTADQKVEMALMEATRACPVATADVTPSFGGATVANQAYTRNEAIPMLQLPAATGGDGALTYSLQGDLPAGLTFDANSRRITGTPTATKLATTYRYIVTDGDVNNADSDELTFTITVNPVGPLSGLSVAAIDGNPAELDVTWKAPPDDGVSGYVVQWKGPGESFSDTARRHVISDGSAGSYRVSYLQPATAYHLRVTQTGGDADGSSVETTAPVSTHGWTVTAENDPSDDQAIDVSWPAYPNATSYVVQWKRTGQPYSDTARRAMVSDALKYEIGNLDRQYRYNIRVTAVETANSVSTDLFTSADVSVFRFAWIDFHVEPVPGDARALWFLWEPPERGVSGYVLAWAEVTEDDQGNDTTSFDTTDRVAITPADTSAHGATDHVGYIVSGAMRGIQPDTVYRGRLSAYSTHGSASHPDGDVQTDDTTTPSEITAITVAAVATTTDKLDVSWTHGAVVNSNAVASYDVQWKLANDAAYPDIGNQANVPSGASHRITGLVEGTTYDVKVTARLDTTNPALVVGDSIEGQGATNSRFPGLTVRPVAGDTAKLDVSWTAYPGAEKYLVQHKTSGASFNTGANVNAPGVSLRLTGLTADTTYTVKVSAFDTGSGSDQLLDSGEATATTLDAMGTVNVAPVLNFGDRLNVSWPAVNRATGYVVQWKTGTGSYSATANFASTPDTSYTVLGLMPSTAYSVRVTARVIIAGNSADGDSAEGNGTTSASPGVTVSKTSLALAEADDPDSSEKEHQGAYTVSLDTDPGAGVTVTVTPTSSAAGAATVGGALSFTGGSSGSWNTPQTVTVTAVNDDIDNPDNRRTTTISHSVSNYGPVTSAGSVTVTVWDDDGVGVSVRPLSLILTEPTGAGSYTVALDSPPTGTVTISVTSSNASVARVNRSSLRFTTSNWSAPQTVMVAAVNDSIENPGNRRTATISHTASGGDYSGVPVRSVSVAVYDDDAPGAGPPGVFLSTGALTIWEYTGAGTYYVVLQSRPTGPVTVSVTSSDTNAATVRPASLTFMSRNWNIRQPVRVTAVNDDIYNAGDRRATISHSASGGGYDGVPAASVSITVLDDDDVTVWPTDLTVDEAGGADAYRVVLDKRPHRRVTISVSSSDTSVATVNTGSLTFDRGNWFWPQWVWVTGVDDDVDNPGDRRTATIRHSASGSGYDGVPVPSVSITVRDDDSEKQGGNSPPARNLGVSVSTGELDISEDGGAGSYWVSLDEQPTGTVTISVSSFDTSVATVRPRTLTFTRGNWSARQTVTVTAVDDDLDNDGDRRTTTISHSASGAGYDQVPVPSVSINVRDDDSQQRDDDPPPASPGVSVSTTVLTVDEAGGAGTYTVLLDEQPTGTVTISVSSSDTGAATVNPASLAFNRENWRNPQTVTVTGVDDALDNEGDLRAATISHAASGGGYDEVPVASVAVTVTDDDAPRNATPPGNVAIDGNGRITWLPSSVPVPSQRYVIRWARGDQPPRLHELCNTDEGRNRFRCGVAVYPESELCTENGRCRFTIKNFDASKHYAVRVRTMEREPTDTWVYARYTPE